jgi:Tfp pilus assembly protein PilO
MNGLLASSKRIHAAGLLFLASVTAAAFFGGFRPMLSDRAAKRELEAQLEVERSASTQLRAAIDRTRREIIEVRARIDAVGINLEPASRVNDRLERLARLAAEIGLQIISVQPGQIRQGQLYGVVPITVQAEGSFAQCVGYLDGLASRFRDMGVRTFDLSNNKAAGVPGKQPPLSLQFELSWYVVPPEKSG